MNLLYFFKISLYEFIPALSASPFIKLFIYISFISFFHHGSRVSQLTGIRDCLDNTTADQIYWLRYLSIVRWKILRELPIFLLFSMIFKISLFASESASSYF